MNPRDMLFPCSNLKVSSNLRCVFAVSCEPRKEDPNICTNLCVIDKNGIPRYPDWFEDHPEDKPE